MNNKLNHLVLAGRTTFQDQRRASELYSKLILKIVGKLARTEPIVLRN